MTRYGPARVNMEQEAGAAGDIFRLAGDFQRFPAIQKDCLNYTQVVVDAGWADLKR
ncbi:MAG: hypothetical protein R3D26_08065 [Cyanobacteriota/Melainabacteria group bacterium]